MIWVMAIACAKFRYPNEVLIPQYHRTFSSIEECENFYISEIYWDGCIKFLPVESPNWQDFVDEFDVVKGDHWKKFYDKALPETMTLDELREYWYDY